MNNIAPLRQVPARLLKAQRWIWLLQTAFWSLVTLGCIAAVIAVVRSTWRRRDSATAVTHGAPGSPGTQAALSNGDAAAPR